MSDFKAKMHQIRFRLGLRPRPRWGSLQRPQTPGPTSKGGKGMRGEGREEKGEKREWRTGEGRKRERRPF